MATTINYFIKPGPRKDGTYAVNIRVTHNRKDELFYLIFITI